MKKLFLLLLIGLFSLSLVTAVPPSPTTTFRGQRKVMDEDSLYLVSSDIQNFGDSFQVELNFSIPVNPQSLNGNTISVNGRPLDRNVKIAALVSEYARFIPLTTRAAICRGQMLMAQGISQWMR